MSLVLSSRAPHLNVAANAGVTLLLFGSLLAALGSSVYQLLKIKRFPI